MQSSPAKHPQTNDMDKKQVDIEQEWRSIGFHRPLGGFWYNYLLVISMSIFGILFMFWLLPNYILPFPDAIGFQDLVKNMFALAFMLADVGVGRSIQRFVAEENIKNPRRALQYLQFFVWFQMITGLIQITIIGFWALDFVRRTQLAYATWFFLAYSTIQYPGMLGVFQGALEGFQRFDKANAISFFQGVVLENTTRIICILVGRWWGDNNPAFGELMGATVGSIVGAYIDDFMAAIIAAIWTKPILKDINPNWEIKHIFFADFDLPLVKECLWFGIKSIAPSLFHQTNQLLQIYLLVTYLPSYAFILGLFSISEMISSTIGTFRFKISSTASEAFNNKKYALVQDYQMRSYQWMSISMGYLVVILVAGAPLLGLIAGTEFMLAAPMIVVMTIGRVAEQPGSINADIFLGCNKPEYYFYQNLVEFVFRGLMMYIGLAWLHWGWLALAAGRITGWWVRWFLGIWLIEKKLFKFRMNWWQTIVAPSLAGFIKFLVLIGLRESLFPMLAKLIGTIPAAILFLILALIIFPILLYFPLYSFFGGWDDESLELFERAVQMSGPSKPIALIILNISKKFARISPLHNKFTIDSTQAKREIEELIEIRESNKRNYLQQIE